MGRIFFIANPVIHPRIKGIDAIVESLNIVKGRFAVPIITHDHALRLIREP